MVRRGVTCTRVVHKNLRRALLCGETARNEQTSRTARLHVFVYRRLTVS